MVGADDGGLGDGAGDRGHPDRVRSVGPLRRSAGWLYVAIVATGYIVSRGLAKAGVGHLPVGALRRQRK
jgi:hypothetical protein